LTAEAELAPGRRPHVVLDGDGHAELRRQGGAQTHVTPAGVGAATMAPVSGCICPVSAMPIEASASSGSARQAIRSGSVARTAAESRGRRRNFGLRDETAVGADGARPDAGASDVDADRGGYAFFSSSLRAAGASSVLAVVHAFLNSFMLEPSERGEVRQAIGAEEDQHDHQDDQQFLIA
jgi:hypothetical protein